MLKQANVALTSTSAPQAGAPFRRTAIVSIASGLCAAARAQAGAPFGRAYAARSRSASQAPFGPGLRYSGAGPGRAAASGSR